MIAEVDFDLAAFGNKEINEYKMRMMDTVASQGFSSAESFYSGNSLESLLLLTEDSFELEKKAKDRVSSSRLGAHASQSSEDCYTSIYLQIFSKKATQSSAAANRGR